MKVLYDVNVIVDVIGETRDFADSFFAVDVSLVRGFECCITSCMPATIQYVACARKMAKRSECSAMLSRLLDVFKVIDVASPDIEGALSSHMVDFEDAAIAYAAARNEVDLIVTRNLRDFRDSPVPAITPADFVETYAPPKYEYDVMDLP